MTAAARRTTPEEFRDVMGHFATGVTVITTCVDGLSYGTTASALMSVSLEPPMLLIAMNRSSVTGDAIGRSGQFVVNVLGEHQDQLARHFSSKDPEKFRTAEVIDGVLGLPLLVGALATLECRVSQVVPGGTHSVFVAEVEAAAANEGAPLAYFRGRFGRLA